MRIKIDGWEQRKVGELLEERNEQAPMSEDYPLMACETINIIAAVSDSCD